MMNRATIWIAATIVAGISVPAAADKPAAAAADREFVTEAASAGLAEVELGKLAGTHAASRRVKEFAQRMVQDHAKTNSELKRVATSKSIALPAKISEQHRQEVNRLSKLRGHAFDQAYMDGMVKDHEEAVEKFRKQAESAEDPDVKAFAAKTLPALESHLQMAKDVSADVAKATSGVAPAGMR